MKSLCTKYSTFSIIVFHFMVNGYYIIIYILLHVIQYYNLDT